MSAPLRDVNQMSFAANRAEVARNTAQLNRLKDQLAALPPVWLYADGEITLDEAIQLVEKWHSEQFLVIGPVTDHERGNLPEDYVSESAAAPHYHLFFTYFVSEGGDILEYSSNHETVVVERDYYGGDFAEHLSYEGARYLSIKHLIAQNPQHFKIPVVNDKTDTQAKAYEKQISDYEARNAELMAARSRSLSVVDMVVISGDRDRKMRHVDQTAVPGEMLARANVEVHAFLAHAGVVNPSRALIMYGDMQVLTAKTPIKEMLRRLAFEHRRPPRILVIEAWRSEKESEAASREESAAAAAGTPPSSYDSSDREPPPRLKRGRGIDTSTPRR